MKGETAYIKAQAIYSSLLRSKNTSTKRKLHNEYMKWIRRAAYAGNGSAQFELGMEYEDVYFFGVNPNANPTRSFYWYRKACDSGIGEACNNLASYYDKGIACKQDKNKALNLYEIAANLGIDVAKQNYQLAKSELRAEEIRAILEGGAISPEGKNTLYKEYLNCLQFSANAGNRDYQYLLAKQFEETDFFDKKPNANYDPKLSQHWYKKACENNLGEACYDLAVCFDQGISCKRNKNKALELYEKAANLGNEAAKRYIQLKKK